MSGEFHNREPQRYTRRDITKRSVAGLAAAAGAAAGLGTIGGIYTGRRENRSIFTPDPIDREPHLSEVAPLFSDATTESIAQGLDLGVKDFLNVQDTLPETFTAHEDEQLFPVFHPHVFEHKDLIYELAKDHKIPPNVIALLMSIESGGDAEANSGVATGLFQLVPDLHLADVDPSEHNNPRINGDRGMIYFAQCLNASREYLEGPESPYPNKEYRFRHPDIFLRAFGMYNAGIGGGKGTFDELRGYEDPQAYQYIQHANRFFKVFEIAKKMRESGMNDEQIVRNLCSDEIDARMEAYIEHGDAFHNFDDAMEYLSANPFREPRNSAERAINTTYRSCKEGKGKTYPQPLNPALSVHTAMGGLFVNADPINNNPDNWLKISTAPNSA